jgi:hypothetical protein
MPSHSCFQIQTRPQVQDHSSLLDSLVSLLSPEELVGDNQYDCANCRGKRDATRRMMLRRLPPFLSLSLQRFVFDQRVGRRVSIGSLCRWFQDPEMFFEGACTYTGIRTLRSAESREHQAPLQCTLPCTSWTCSCTQGRQTMCSSPIWTGYDKVLHGHAAWLPCAIGVARC